MVLSGAPSVRHRIAQGEKGQKCARVTQLPSAWVVLVTCVADVETPQTPHGRVPCYSHSTQR